MELHTSAKMKSDYKKIEGILKSGIETFIDVAVKKHQEKLLEELPDHLKAASGFTESLSCHADCTFQTLKPLHRPDMCQSQSKCPCKGKSIYKRPCPQSICDHMLEGIIKDHSKRAPNFRNTVISKWTEQHWEIACCFMSKKSVSVKDATLLDLLYLLVNNTFILAKLQRKSSLRKREGNQHEGDITCVLDSLHKCIKAVETKRLKKVIKEIRKLLSLTNDEKSNNAYNKIRETKCVFECLSIRQRTNIRSKVSKQILVNRSTVKKSNGIVTYMHERGISDFLKLGSSILILVSPVPLTGLYDAVLSEMNNYDVISSSQDISNVSFNHDQDVFAFDQCLQNSLNEYFQSLWGEHVKKKNGFTECFRVSFQQSVTHVDKHGTTLSAVSAVFDETSRGLFLIATVPDERSRVDDRSSKAQLSSKQSCMFSILDCQLGLLTNELKTFNFKPFSGVYILSKSFATEKELQLEDIHNHVRDFVLPEQNNCLIIIDSSLNMSMFDNMGESLKRHTIVFFAFDFVKHVSAVMKLKCPTLLMQLNPVSGLTVTSVTKTPIKPTIVSRYLEKCGTKVGFNNVKVLTLNNITALTSETIHLDKPLKKVEQVKVSNVIKVNIFPSLHSIVLKKCNFVPVIGASILDIEVEMSTFLLSSVVDSLVPLTYQILKNCPKFQTIKVCETLVGTKKFGFWLKRHSIETTLRYLNESHTDDETSKNMIHIEMSKILDAANCDLVDFKTIEDNDERTLFLKCLAISLKLKDDSLVDVVAAKHKCSQNSEIVFVCYMKDNFDVSKEHTEGNYKGFSTYHRSYDLVSSESRKAEDSIPIEKWKEMDTETLTDIGNVIKACTDSLMRKHSNLEAISISLGKAIKETLDTRNGPCIVLFVRLKSFIPYNEDDFPAELCNPNCPNIKFTVDVREGFYTPVADYRPEHTPIGTLVMGCSIGCEGFISSGSLGPFVEWKTENSVLKTGFLTACHVFWMPEENFRTDFPDVVQPANMDDYCDIHSRNPSPDKICGKVAAIEFSEEVDAAVVEITARYPTNGAFIPLRKGQITDIFKDKRTCPQYVNGSSVFPQDCVNRDVIKVGKETQLKVGHVLHDKCVVRITSRPLDISCPRTGNRKIQKIMKGQIEVRGRGKSAFCDLGDSGAGVFLINGDDSLSCVGILIGKIEEGNMALVTPINQVLDKLSSKLNCRLHLKSFLPETR